MVEALAASSWEELGLEAGSSRQEIISHFREFAILNASNDISPLDISSYNKKARAYRYLCSIPPQDTPYEIIEFLPTLRPMEKEINSRFRASGKKRLF